MRSVRFGPFEADLASGELRRDGAVLPLQDLPFRLLAALLERPGEVVSRADLTARLWGSETFVDSVAGLNTAVAKLRTALGDDADRPMYVETVPKRGYRFIGQIETAEAGRRLPRRAVLASVAGLVLIGALAFFALRPRTRVAVVLFDNETEVTELSRLAQGLTDATVFALTERRELDVIGNAAILRTERPFRDVEAIGEALDADFVILGQVQTVDGSVLVRTHLIRADDLAHVWVETFEPDQGDAELLESVASSVTAAVVEQAAL
jgi:DNA-binding winged helix-turn-helix (wHTH) protein/TolB-like protein